MTYLGSGGVQNVAIWPLPIARNPARKTYVGIEEVGQVGQMVLSNYSLQ